MRSGGGGGTATNGGDGMTAVPWRELKIVPLVTTTGDASAKPLTEEEHLKQLLRLTAADPRPTFLYFHFDHEEDKPEKGKKAKEVSAAGKASLKQCGYVNDDVAVRWEMLFRCVEVDMDRSDKALAARVGLGDAASYAVVDKDLNVLAQSEDVANAKGLAAFLEKTLKTKFPDYWKLIDERLVEQRKTLEEARALAKEKKVEEALTAYRTIARSDLRVGDFWEDAVKEYEALDAKFRGEKK